MLVFRLPSRMFIQRGVIHTTAPATQQAAGAGQPKLCMFNVCNAYYDTPATVPLRESLRGKRPHGVAWCGSSPRHHPPHEYQITVSDAFNQSAKCMAFADAIPRTAMSAGLWARIQSRMLTRSASTSTDEKQNPKSEGSHHDATASAGGNPCDERWQAA